MKINFFFFFWGGGGGGRVMGGRVWGQGGCEWRSEAFVKFKKKIWGRGGGLVGGGVRVGGASGWMCMEK